MISGGMDTPKRIAAVVVVFGIMIASTQHVIAAEEMYLINFDRPTRTGDRVRCALSTARLTSRTIKWEGYPSPVSDESAEGFKLVADAIAIEADADGNAQKVEYTVQTLTRILDKKETQILPAGTKVLASAGKSRRQNIFTVNGHEPDATTLAALRFVIHLAPSDESASDNPDFGFDRAHKIGESWSINAESMSKHHNRTGENTKPEDFSGNVKLVGKVDCDGIDCFRIEAEVAQANYAPFPMRDLVENPPTSKPTAAARHYDAIRATLTTRSTWYVPVDPTLPAARLSYSATMSYQDDGSREGHKYHSEQTLQYEWHVRTSRTAPATEPSGQK